MESTAKEIYPEHEKLHKVKEEAQAAGDFIEWYRASGFCLAQWHDSRYEPCLACEHPVYHGIWDGCQEEDCDCKNEGENFIPEGLYRDFRQTEEILAEYFDIDLRKLNYEKDMMLSKIRGEEIISSVERKDG